MEWLKSALTSKSVLVLAGLGAAAAGYAMWRRYNAGAQEDAIEPSGTDAALHTTYPPQPAAATPDIRRSTSNYSTEKNSRNTTPLLQPRTPQLQPEELHMGAGDDADTAPLPRVIEEAEHAQNALIVAGGVVEVDATTTTQVWLLSGQSGSFAFVSGKGKHLVYNKLNRAREMLWC